VIIDEAKIQGGQLETFENASAYGAIVSYETCIKYKIIFKNYVAYCVTNETCAGSDPGEQFAGTVFRTYSKSRFLDYIAASGGGLIETLDGYTHYEVVTLNQIIDVAATREPEIEILGSAGATNRWTRAAGACFASLLVRRGLIEFAPPRQLKRWAATVLQ